MFKEYEKFSTVDDVNQLAKNAVDTAIANVDPIAKELVRDVTGAYNYGKTNYNENTESLYNAEFKKMPVQKKTITTQNSSSFIFLGFVLLTILSVFGLFFFKYRNSYVTDLIGNINNETIKMPSYLSSMLMNLIFIAIICALITFFFLIFNLIVFKKKINQKEILKLLLSVVTIGVPVLAITMATIGNMPLMLRSFENTFGYWWIKTASLKETAQKLFDNGNYNDYSIISTQLFEENFNYYLKCMNEDYKPGKDAINLNRFKGVYLKKEFFDGEKLKLDASEDNDLFKLLKMVVRKRHISEATWISLATAYVMYVSYLYNQ